jgi:hypothetical protein
MLRSERGFAVPTVLLMMIAALAIASAAAFASISAQSGTTHDSRSKSAFAVAESGVSDAMLRYNLTAATPHTCIPVSAQGPDAQGWCQPVTANSVNGGSFTYWVHPPSATPSSRCASVSAAPAACLEVVSLGTLSGVTRRVAVTATSASGRQMFGDAAVKSQNGISMDSNATVRAAAATNGDITLASNARQCGTASVGVGHQLTQAGNSGYFSDVNCTTATTSYDQKDLILPPVNQGDAAANNNNSRFFALDPISDNKADACWNGLNGNGAAGSCGPRELSIDHNSAVTIAGSVYSLCRLTLKSNSKLYVAAGANTVIYFDSPEACGYASGSTQLQLDSNTRISPANTSSTSIALLFVGSTSLATTIQLNSNTEANAQCSQNFIVYAPLTDLDLNSNSVYCGAVAGKTIHLDSNAEIRAGVGTDAFNLPNTAAYYVIDRNGYIECSAAAATPPNTGC